MQETVACEEGFLGSFVDACEILFVLFSRDELSSDMLFLTDL